jgi:hypothetical protein
MEVPASDLTLYSDEMSLSNSRQQETLSLVQLYSALVEVEIEPTRAFQSAAV